MPLLCIGERVAAMQSLGRESMHPPQVLLAVEKASFMSMIVNSVSLRSPADHLQHVKMEHLINWFTCLKSRMGRKLWNKSREGGLPTMTFGDVSVNCCLTLCTWTLPPRHAECHQAKSGHRSPWVSCHEGKCFEWSITQALCLGICLSFLEVLWKSQHQMEVSNLTCLNCYVVVLIMKVICLGYFLSGKPNKDHVGLPAKTDSCCSTHVGLVHSSNRYNCSFEATGLNAYTIMSALRQEDEK